MNKIKKVFQLADTPCQLDYDGCGWGWLIVNHGRPQKLIYHPERPEGMPEDWQVQIHVKNEIAAEVEQTSEVWFGMTSCWEFCAMHKLYPSGEKKS